jgi:chromosome segregation ATPase
MQFDTISSLAKRNPVLTAISAVVLIGFLLSFGGWVGEKVTDIRYNAQLAEKDSQLKTKNAEIRDKDLTLAKNAEELKAAKADAEAIRKQLETIRMEGARRDQASRKARKDYHDAKAGNNLPRTAAELDSLLCELYPEECK